MRLPSRQIYDVYMVFGAGVNYRASIYDVYMVFGAGVNYGAQSQRTRVRDTPRVAAMGVMSLMPSRSPACPPGQVGLHHTRSFPLF